MERTEYSFLIYQGIGCQCDKRKLVDTLMNTLRHYENIRILHFYKTIAI